MFWESVGASVVGNVVTIVLTVGVGILLVLARWRALMRFWDIRDTKKLRIYLSHLRIVPGGALDAHGVARTYQGRVVTQLETETAALVKSLFFAAIPGEAIQPNWLKALLLVNADVQVCPSPDSASKIDPEGAVLSLGSPGYNTISEMINANSPVKFGPNNSKIVLPGDLTITDPHHSVVVRIRFGGRTWFYAAGLAEGGTAAAAYYLASSWKRLDRVYRGSPSFFVLLETTGDDYRNVRAISEGAILITS